MPILVVQGGPAFGALSDPKGFRAKAPIAWADACFARSPILLEVSMSHVRSLGRPDHGVRRKRHRNAAEVRETVVGHSKPATA